MADPEEGTGEEIQGRGMEAAEEVVARHDGGDQGLARAGSGEILDAQSCRAFQGVAGGDQTDPQE